MSLSTEDKIKILNYIIDYKKYSGNLFKIRYDSLNKDLGLKTTSTDLSKFRNEMLSLCKHKHDQSQYNDYIYVKLPFLIKIRDEYKQLNFDNQLTINSVKQTKLLSISISVALLSMALSLISLLLNNLNHFFKINYATYAITTIFIFAAIISIFLGVSDLTEEHSVPKITPKLTLKEKVKSFTHKNKKIISIIIILLLGFLMTTSQWKEHIRSDIQDIKISNTKEFENILFQVNSTQEQEINNYIENIIENKINNITLEVVMLNGTNYSCIQR